MCKEKPYEKGFFMKVLIICERQERMKEHLSITFTECFLVKTVRG